MIEIVIPETGDHAEADTPEAALLAATTLCQEAYEARGIATFKPTAVFYVDGEPVARVPEAQLWLRKEAS